MGFGKWDTIVRVLRHLVMVGPSLLDFILYFTSSVSEEGSKSSWRGIGPQGGFSVDVGVAQNDGDGVDGLVHHDYVEDLYADAEGG